MYKELKIVAHFSYLGIVFSKTGSFNIAKKELVNKGIKAMYEVLRKGRIHNLSIKCRLDLLGFLFRSEFFFRTTQELEYFFFVAQSANFFSRI